MWSKNQVKIYVNNGRMSLKHIYGSCKYYYYMCTQKYFANINEIQCYIMATTSPSTRHKQIFNGDFYTKISKVFQIHNNNNNKWKGEKTYFFFHFLLSLPFLATPFAWLHRKKKSKHWYNTYSHTQTHTQSTKFKYLNEH